jgi:hypothetical protein
VVIGDFSRDGVPDIATAVTSHADGTAARAVFSNGVDHPSPAAGGDTFTGQWSRAADQWVTVGSVTIPMRPEVHAGLAVTSHDAGATTTAHFSGFFFP